MANKTQNYILHLLGSLLFISIPILSSPDLDSKRELFELAPFRSNFLAYALLLVFFYFNYLYLIPRFYFTKKYRLFFLYLIICFAIVALLPNMLMVHNRGFVPNMTDMPMPPRMDEMPREFRGIHPSATTRFFFLPSMHGGSLLQFLLVFSLSFLLRTSQRLEYIQNEKLKTEVSYLRAQINPHFLFNTLNSLYALALEKSDAAPEAILKLSAMMRYVVTESGRDRVALENEINYIKNYISLQQLRMDGSTPLSFIVTGSTIGKTISPLLLIPFIENAFKYGLNPEENSAIDINIDIAEDTLEMRVKNNKVNTNLPPEETSGHGLTNTRQRLEFLYPEKHSLTIFDTNRHFEVQLKLTLV
ncbi:sensor histidine kinase [Flavobacterium sp. Sd200]|uniref:sensor histidine kinase n=1 Tax=Flavobacterium sp. Sd200 TaxID=2692211 RepID=UPI00137083EF|nr:histidine kinase [Flavobacterium sp. Sd200]MXN91536.1 sensor histidine kinase [Flavobacterium sp. Sd200]